MRSGQPPDRIVRGLPLVRHRLAATDNRRMIASARQRPLEPPHGVSSHAVSPRTPHLLKPVARSPQDRAQQLSRNQQPLPAPEEQVGGGGRNARAPSRAYARTWNVPRRFTLENRRLPLTPRSFGKLRNSRFRCTHFQAHRFLPQQKSPPGLCRTCGR